MKNYIAGIIVLAGFVLNFAFTVTPTKTEAVFGSTDSSYPVTLAQESGTVFMSDSLGIEPGDISEEVIVSPITIDSVVAK